MALDNAEFIAELSVLDPPGTDPLNQGDDHIRTTKKAVQQSFPNIDAAVPQSAAQMAQMAIKNEQNTFTQVNIFSQQQQGGNGSAAAPLWSFQNSPNMGFFRNASAQLGVAFGGIQVATFASTNFDLSLNIRVNDGSAVTPTYNFLSRNAGMYASAGDRLNWATAGVQRAFVDVSQFQSKVVFSAIDGSEPAPGYAFASDLGTGMWASATSCNLSANGQTIASFTSSSDIFAAEGRSWAGNSLRTASRPAFNFNSDSDTGFYNNAPNSIGWAANGVGLGTLDAAAIWTAAGISIHSDGNNTPTNPAYAFNNDQDTGMYRIGTNILGFATAGVKRFEIQATGRAIFDGTGTIENRSQAGTTAASYQLKPGGVLFFEMASGTTSSRLWSLVRYNDAGGFLGLPIQVDRDTGGVIFNELPTTNPGGSGKLWKSSGFVAIT